MNCAAKPLSASDSKQGPGVVRCSTNHRSSPAPSPHQSSHFRFGPICPSCPARYSPRGGQMSSQLKSDTARANGAKSHGPVTPEGRAVSSRNSLRHGFTAGSVVLPTESQEDFLALLDSYTDHFNPQGGVEMDLVQAMAAARWRLQRICNIEAALLSTEIVRRAEDIDEEFENMKNVDHLAWVFEKLADHGQ